MKRFFDIIIATLSIIVFAPLLLFICFLIRIDTKGPVFYLQRRMGKNGRSIHLYKFRTMIYDDRIIVWAGKTDCRITRIGRILRPLCLDELPQLINVLIGDMSIVGPRAARSFELKYYSKKVMARLNVKPGLTGLAQVNMPYYKPRSENSFHKYIEKDLEYVRDHTIMMDLNIILKSVRLVFTKAK